jgi:predicted nucleotidyltransferase
VLGEHFDGSGKVLLVDLEEPNHADLLDLVGVESYCNDLLVMKVDLIENNGVRKLIGKRIINEITPVWITGFWNTLKTFWI